MKDFNVKLNIKQDPKEMDYIGFTSDKSIFRYLLTARSNYWDIIGSLASYRNANVGPVVVSHQFEILLGIKSNDELAVYTRVSEIGTSSISFIYEIYDSKKNLCVRAKEVLVGFDFDKNKTVLVNEDLKKRIEEIESGKD
jgi:acyl-CoA thioesterase FadM